LEKAGDFIGGTVWHASGFTWLGTRQQKSPINSEQSPQENVGENTFLHQNLPCLANTHLEFHQIILTTYLIIFTFPAAFLDTTYVNLLYAAKLPVFKGHTRCNAGFVSKMILFSVLKTLGLHDFCNFSPNLLRVVYELQKSIVAVYKKLG